NAAITEVSDLSLYVMTSEFGSQSQLEKIDMIDFADLIAINKADHRGAEDALRDVRKQYRRSRKLFTDVADSDLPVHLTQASQFNDPGCNRLFMNLLEVLKKHPECPPSLKTERRDFKLRSSDRQFIVPPDRQAYLSEIV